MIVKIKRQTCLLENLFVYHGFESPGVACTHKGPGLIRGFFGLRFSENLNFLILC